MNKIIYKNLFKPLKVNGLKLKNRITIAPLYLGINFLGMGIYGAWGCIVGFIATLCLLVSLRYRSGKWERMLVIESKPGPV